METLGPRTRDAKRDRKADATRALSHVRSAADASGESTFGALSRAQSGRDDALLDLALRDRIARTDIRRLMGVPFGIHAERDMPEMPDRLTAGTAPVRRYVMTYCGPLGMRKLLAPEPMSAAQVTAARKATARARAAARKVGTLVGDRTERVMPVTVSTARAELATMAFLATE